MFDGILNALKQVTEWIVDGIFNLIIYLLSFIPAPEFVDPTITALNVVADKSGYALWLTGFDVGLPIMMTSLAIRFLIRRLPFIG